MGPEVQRGEVFCPRSYSLSLAGPLPDSNLCLDWSKLFWGWGWGESAWPQPGHTAVCELCTLPPSLPGGACCIGPLALLQEPGRNVMFHSLPASLRDVSTSSYQNPGQPFCSTASEYSPGASLGPDSGMWETGPGKSSTWIELTAQSQGMEKEEKSVLRGSLSLGVGFVIWPLLRAEVMWVGRE